MAWERRKAGAATGYYYQSVRVGEVVQKVYLGRGEAAHEAARDVQHRQASRREAKRLLREARLPSDEAGELAKDVQEWAVGLLHVWLILTGHHKQQRQWRRKRHGQKTKSGIESLGSLPDE
jgi:hypothetical protein